LAKCTSTWTSGASSPSSERLITTASAIDLVPPGRDSARRPGGPVPHRRGASRSWIHCFGASRRGRSAPRCVELARKGPVPVAWKLQ